jgi:acyl dehydratase
MINIEEINIGDRYKFIFDYSEKVHNDFRHLSGDDSRIHTDIKFAKKNGFNKVLGYAFALLAFQSNIYGTQFPGGNELCLKQISNFRKPFYIGDKIEFNLEVSSLNIENKIIGIETAVSNSIGSIVYTGSALLQLSLR